MIIFQSIYSTQHLLYLSVPGTFHSPLPRILIREIGYISGCIYPRISIGCKNRYVLKYNIFDIYIQWEVILSHFEGFLTTTG